MNHKYIYGHLREYKKRERERERRSEQQRGGSSQWSLPDGNFRRSVNIIIHVSEISVQCYLFLMFLPFSVFSPQNMDRESGVKPRVKFANRTRFLVMVLVTLCLSLILSNTLTLNFTVICMEDPKPEIEHFNSTGTIFQNQNGSFYEVFIYFL